MKKLILIALMVLAPIGTHAGELCSETVKVKDTSNMTGFTTIQRICVDGVFIIKVGNDTIVVPYPAVCACDSNGRPVLMRAKDD